MFTIMTEHVVVLMLAALICETNAEIWPNVNKIQIR